MPTIHDPAFDLPSRPPFPFGASPFHIRGSVYASDLRQIAERVPGGLEAALRRADDPALRAFLVQPFRAAGWYDIQPLAYLTHAAASARGIAFEHLVRENARRHADDAARGLAGVVLRAFSYETLARWLPRAASAFDDFGSVETHVVEPGHLRGERRGVPKLLVRNVALAAAEFLEAILRHAGAREPRVYPLEPTLDGEQRGYPLYRIPIEIVWNRAG